MTSSGLQFEVCVVHFKWIKGYVPITLEGKRGEGRGKFFYF